MDAGEGDSRDEAEAGRLDGEAPLAEDRAERVEEGEDEGVRESRQQRQAQDDGLLDEHDELREGEATGRTTSIRARDARGEVASDDAPGGT